MKKLFILLLIPFLSFQSFSQTDEVDRLKAIWINEMIEFGDISIKNIDWDATFVPYWTGIRNSYATSNERRFREILNKLGLRVLTYNTKTQAKDANNREMTLSKVRTTKARYWIDFTYGWSYTIQDRLSANETVGTIVFNDKVKAYKNYEKAYNKYIKKNKIDKRRAKSRSYVLWEEILKRYNK
jgi:hypothetical protein